MAGLFDFGQLGQLGDLAANAKKIMGEIQPAMEKWTAFFGYLREKLDANGETLARVDATTLAIYRVISDDPKTPEVHQALIEHAKEDPRVNGEKQE